MPSKKRQFGCRPDDETWERMESLKGRIAAGMNLEKISDSQLLRLAMIALEKEYPPTKGKK